MHKKWQVIALSLISTTSAFANPTGAEVVQGQVAIATEGQTVQIQAADKSIIHWQDFSIQSGELTRFVQPDISSTVLNRVVGVNQSMINGVLEANGRVILVNPAGVIIGKEGVIRTADFIASTTDILNLSDWSIRTDGASASQIDSTNCSALINHEGLIQATGVDRSGGRVLLMASHVAVDGQVQTDGGRIELLGERVQVGSNALLDASSMNGGGTILVGGDYQGGNPDIQNSRAVQITSGAQFSADALQNGDGGRVIFWSDENTSFEGLATARGGQVGGNGGFVEVSSPGQFHFHGLVNTTAPMGKTGTLLLDPCDIEINGTSPSSPLFPVTLPATYNPGGTTATLYYMDVQNALATNDVVITTSSGSGGSSFGNITWDAGFPITWTTGQSLSLTADADINLNSDIICTAAGPINLTATKAINIGDSSNTTSTNIVTSGPILINAGTGVTIEGGSMMGADATVIGKTAAGTIGVTITNGDLTIESVTAECEASLGSPTNSSGTVTIMLNHGDLNLNSDNMGYANINSDDHVNIMANNVNVDARGARSILAPLGTCLINVNATSGSTASTINLNGSWTSNATPTVPGDLPNYVFSFDNSTLTMGIGGNLTLHNTSTYVQGQTGSGFEPLGIGGTIHVNGNVVVDLNAAGGRTELGANTDLTLSVGGSLTVQNLNQGLVLVGGGGTTVDISVGGDILLSGNNSSQVAFLGSFALGAGTLTLSSGGNITVESAGGIFLPQDGTAIIIANKNITLSQSLIDVPNPNNPSPNLNLTIVIDNQDPFAPNIGPYGFSLDGTSMIFSMATTVPVQIYTAARSQNSISGTINQAVFVPGPYDVNTSSEQWSTYYTGTFIGAAPYMIIYKEPQSYVPTPPGGSIPPSTFTLTALAAPQLAEIIGNMFDTIDEFEYPLSYYRDAFCVKWQDGQQLQKGARQFNNDSCYWVQVENYRKYYPYREKHRID